MGLKVIAISNPAAPTLTGALDTSGFAKGVYVSGNYAFVADGDAGLKVIAISNPAAPTLTGALDTSGNAYSVYVSGNYAFVADSSAGLKVIEIRRLEVTTDVLPMGMEMMEYNATLQTTNGTSPYTWSVAEVGGLPEGLSCSIGGIISGTPTLAGTNLVTFVVQDSVGASTNKRLEIVIAPNPNTRPVISSNAPPAGAVSMNEATNQLFQVWAYDPEGSNLTYSWLWDNSAVGSNASSYTHTTVYGDAGLHRLRCYVSDDLWSNSIYAQWDVTVLYVDTDSDGLPDWWEQQWFGNTTTANTTTDSDADGLNDRQEFQLNGNPTVTDTDGDGLSDLREWVAGTSLTNAGVLFRVEDWLRENEGETNAPRFMFYWDTVTGRLYSVYSVTNLLGPWVTNVYRVPGAGNRRAFTNEDTEAPRKFFRIGVELAPTPTPTPTPTPVPPEVPF